MRVAIDIRRMTEFGVGTYIRNVVRTLGRLDQENSYFLIGSPEKVTECGSLPHNFHCVPLYERDNTVKGCFAFRAIVRRFQCDLAHIPHLFWLPRNLSCPYVITVHDVLDHLYRARENSNLRKSLHFHLTRRVLKGASRILAVSQFTKTELEKYFQVPPENIQVVYNAIDERFLRGHASPPECQILAERYQITYPFVLYAGSVAPQKNVTRIIEAFSALKTELGKENKLRDLKLIIIGDDLSGHPDLRRTVIRSGMQNDVRFLGFVPIEVLRVFYDAAKVFVFPSLYEGFGLPPLEAMAHGTPVVTSNTSSLPEVTGNAAVLVNPENVFEIMRGLHCALVDAHLRETLKQRCYEQSARFSWELSVRRIQQAYREIVGERSLSATTLAAD